MSDSSENPDDTGTDWDRIGDLLNAWEEANAAGRDIPLEDLCRDCPELLPHVAAGVRTSRRLAQLWGRVEATGGAARSDPLRYQQGEVIGNRFRLEEEIARGGTAVIWRCRMDASVRKVAVKLPHSPHPNPDKDITELLLREGERAQGLFHPNIVPVYSYGRHGDVAYIAFKLVEGETLRDRMHRATRCPIGLPEVRSIAWQMAYALAYAHGQRLIHRDLKPTNVLLEPAGRVFLTDFGIALTLGEVASGLAGVTGTECYMAPEQLRRGALGPTCDVYAFGVILYELLTGHLPSKPSTTHPDPYRPADEARLASGLRAVAQRCMAPNPGSRYASGDQLLMALRRVEAGQGSAPAPALPPPPPAPGGSGDRSALAGVGRWCKVAVAVAVLATVLAVVGSALVAEIRNPVRQVPVTITVVVGCFGIGLAVVRPRRAALGFLVATGFGLALTFMISGRAEAILRSVSDAIAAALRLS